MHPLRRLSTPALSALADALAAGRLVAPFSASMVGARVPAEHVEAVCATLRGYQGEGMTPGHIAQVIRVLVEEREAVREREDRVQLVWSPPDLDRVDARDTAVVVQDLFRQAKESVLIASYALDEGPKASALFGVLARRMDEHPELAVRVFANIHRKHLDTTSAHTLVRAFARRLRDTLWPGERLPEVYYDPRSLEATTHKRAVLHAKVVVIDQRWTLLTSANFTEAAHERNIEAGLLVEDPHLAQRVARQFDLLVESGALQRVPLL